MTTTAPQPELITLGEHVQLLPHGDLTGALRWDPTRSALVFAHDQYPGETEVLSTVLIEHGLLPELGNCFIKNWTNHFGITASLAEQHLIRVVRQVTVGPFRSVAFEVEIVLPESAAQIAA